MNSTRLLLLFVLAAVIVVGGAFIAHGFQQGERETLAYALHHPIAINIYLGPPGAQSKPDAQGRIVSTQLVTLHKDSPAFRSLQSVQQFFSHNPSSGATADFTLMVIGRLGTRVKHYGYYANTGVLGAGGEWCRVPTEFKMWMDDLLKHPKPPESSYTMPSQNLMIEGPAHERSVPAPHTKSDGKADAQRR